jgi:hypothetical protein
MRRARLRWLRDAIFIALTTFLLAEAGLRALPLFVGDPLKSLIVEARRIPLSNTRTYGGTRILLPAAADADMVVVGDSMAFGTYVRERDTFAAVLARDTGRRVVNLSVGSQTALQYQRMAEVSVAYRPELLIYSLFANDFLYDGEVAIRQLAADVPVGGRAEDRALYLERIDLKDRTVAIGKWFSNLSAINLLRKLLAQPAAAHQSVAWQRGPLSYMFAPAGYWDPQIDWTTPAVRRATAINAALIEQTGAFARAHGIRLIVLLMPSKEMVHGPMVGDAIFRDTHHQTYRELAARLRAQQIEVIDLTPALRARAAAGHQLFHTIDGHLNEEGHRTVAAALVGATR